MQLSALFSKTHGFSNKTVSNLMKTMNRLILVILTISATMLVTAPSSSAAGFSRPDELVVKSEFVFKNFMADPNMAWFRDNISRAKGIFIVPQMLRGGFIIGGSGGSGVLLARDDKTGQWSYPAFYTIGSVSVGLQIGADASQLIFMIMTDKGLNAMLTTEFKLGGDIAVAAGPVGGSAKVQIADVLAFGLSQGAYGGISVEGAVIAPRYEWNSSYYGRAVTPFDILIKRSVTNPQADPLRAILPLPVLRSRNVQTLGSR